MLYTCSDQEGKPCQRRRIQGGQVPPHPGPMPHAGALNYVPSSRASNEALPHRAAAQLRVRRRPPPLVSLTGETNPCFLPCAAFALLILSLLPRKKKTTCLGIIRWNNYGGDHRIWSSGLFLWLFPYTEPDLYICKMVCKSIKSIFEMGDKFVPNKSQVAREGATAISTRRN